ncbi:hypothetical protein VNO78_28854 [Psophocarpus tetragonolobus]|uniref:Pentatricopeptide repeat-containing protein n=1 Tax=Psophocarpus tetragonolobus TaxID=3891 RepID=A0AAN9RTZ5_PSOTE
MEGCRCRKRGLRRSRKRTLQVGTPRFARSLCGEGKIDYACKVFDKMPELDNGLWNTIITRYARNGLVHEALDLFGECVVFERKYATMSIDILSDLVEENLDLTIDGKIASDC